MLIQHIIQSLETLAPPCLQESYDNSGLQVGNRQWQCTGVLCCLDSTEAVVHEAITANANLIVAHHPIIFSPLKSITGKHYIEQVIILAIQHNIAIYAIHTNLDNVITGVNHTLAAALGLVNTTVLLPKANQLQKLYTYIPNEYAESLRQALYNSGAGQIGNYNQCSFTVLGTSTFTGNEHSNPVIGKPLIPTKKTEVKIEIVYPTYLQSSVIKTLKANHPYEEVAYEIIALQNNHNSYGSGLVGTLPEPMEPNKFLQLLQKKFVLKVIRHSPLLHHSIHKVALCGGSGSFLTKYAIAAAADVYITADVKYHEFFEANNQLIIADIGHYESEQYTINLIFQWLQQNFPNFAVQKTTINTNSTHYFV